MKILDLFCCAGGAGYGYHLARFEVFGVDIVNQPRYPFGQLTGNATALDVAWIRDNFDAVHASPPCQKYSSAQRIQNNDHPDLIDPTRDLLRATGLPYVIENVVGAPLRAPAMLCGAMFPELRVYRHRLFETNFPLTVPPHPPHVVPLTKMGRTPVDGAFMHCVGNFSGVREGREAMGTPWMNRDEIREAIPPAYTAFIGQQLRAYLNDSAYNRSK